MNFLICLSILKPNFHQIRNKETILLYESEQLPDEYNIWSGIWFIGQLNLLSKIEFLLWFLTLSSDTWNFFATQFRIPIA